MGVFALSSALSAACLGYTLGVRHGGRVQQHQCVGVEALVRACTAEQSIHAYMTAADELRTDVANTLGRVNAARRMSDARSNARAEGASSSAEPAQSAEGGASARAPRGRRAPAAPFENGAHSAT